MKVLLTGGTGFLGQHVERELSDNEHSIWKVDSFDYDLRNYEETKLLLEIVEPEVIVNLAANVGGIQYNLDNSYDLFRDNILINFNIIDVCRFFNIKKFIQIGTTCSYPAYTETPFVEEDFWNGYPELSNSAYAMAKKISLVQLEHSGHNWNYLVLANLYGPGDNFTVKKSHVIPALIKKFVDARTNDESEVVVWGTGEPTRDFLYVQDAANCIAKCLDLCDNNVMYNVGSGFQISIKVLAQVIKKLTNYQGKIVWDISKPDGQMIRLLDINRVSKFWYSETSLEEGLLKTIKFYEETYV